MLFEAHRDGNDPAFLRTAEAIIAEELASNHHHATTDLQRALGKGREQMNASVRALDLGSRFDPTRMEFGRDPHWQCPLRLHRIENSALVLAPIAERRSLAPRVPLLSSASSGARGDISNQMLRAGKTLESSVDAERYAPANPAKR